MITSIYNFLERLENRLLPEEQIDLNEASKAVLKRAFELESCGSDFLAQEAFLKAEQLKTFKSFLEATENLKTINRRNQNMIRNEWKQK